MPLNALLERLISRIESAQQLDSLADRLAGYLDPLLGNARIVSSLSGTQVGHPLHPALVAAPIGCFVSAGYLDAVGGSDAAAERLLLAGLISTVPAALTGAADWSYTTGAERRVGLVHALLNYAGLALFGSSLLARRHRRHRRGVGLAVAGTATLGLAGWLGGHLAYARGVGVDTTAFQVAPADWTAVLPEADLAEGQPTLVHAAGVPVLLVRTGGALYALSDRCSHRGAPLHEGSLSGANCIVCPWHDSEFRLSDGAVARGPATRPQPSWQVRVHAGEIEVRRATEPGSLRTNPVS